MLVIEACKSSCRLDDSVVLKDTGRCRNEGHRACSSSLYG